VQDVLSELNPLSGGTHTGESCELRNGEFWAVRDVSFEVKRGECLGLIGHNGAGKTTLLKMLNGLIKPDSGRIEMFGRVGALIALGTGFNPVLSGRENIYVNASILGLQKKEIDRKIDDIVDFSEIGEFIDAPVQSYSSGMHVRLGFAVATALKPDVLILDEILSVGDARFRMKCYDRLHSIMKECAVILVSHEMSNILNVANSVGYMKSGQFTYYSNKSEGIVRYEKDMGTKANQSGPPGGHKVLTKPLVSLDFVPETPEIKYGDSLRVKLICDSIEAQDVSMSIRLANKDGVEVLAWDSHRYGKSLTIPKNESIIEVEIPEIRLRAGQYSCSLYIWASGSIKFLAHVKNCCLVNIMCDSLYESPIAYIADQGVVKQLSP
jgi:lipopolysaccharide transport system ATP-binding protein